MSFEYEMVTVSWCFLVPWGRELEFKGDVICVDERPHLVFAVPREPGPQVYDTKSFERPEALVQEQVVLKRRIVMWDHYRGVVYVADKDEERFDEAVALFSMASRLIEWISDYFPHPNNPRINRRGYKFFTALAKKLEAEGWDYRR